MTNTCKIFLLPLAVALLFMTGCQSAQEPLPRAVMMPEVSIRETVDAAEPEKAVAEIHELFSECKATELDDVEMEDRLGISGEDVREHHIYLSDPKSGLVDLVILLPVQDKRDALRESLYRYRDRCVEEYRNYDILNSLSIAQEAQVFDQGDYLILVMTPDNEAAREIIDKFIPL